MTAIELLFFVLRLCFSIGALVGLWNVHPVLGWVVGITVFLGFPKLISILVLRFGDRPLGKPVCPNGCCYNDDYEWTRSEKDLPVCKCKCGIEFIANGNRFLKLDSTGKKQLYMVWTRKGGWTVDKGGRSRS